MPGCPSSRAWRKMRKSSRSFSGGTGSVTFAGSGVVAFFESIVAGWEAQEFPAAHTADMKSVATRTTAKSRWLARRFMVCLRAKAADAIDLVGDSRRRPQSKGNPSGDGRTRGPISWEASASNSPALLGHLDQISWLLHRRPNIV